MTADRVPSERNIIEASTDPSLSAAFGTPAAAASRFQVLGGRNEMRAPTSPLSPLILPQRHCDTRSGAAAAPLCPLGFKLLRAGVCPGGSTHLEARRSPAGSQRPRVPELNCSGITQTTLLIIVIHILKNKIIDCQRISNVMERN